MPRSRYDIKLSVDYPVIPPFALLPGAACGTAATMYAPSWRFEHPCYIIVGDESARVFTQDFYEMLSHYLPVDECVSRAREGLMLAAGVMSHLKRLLME